MKLVRSLRTLLGSTIVIFLDSATATGGASSRRNDPLEVKKKQGDRNLKVPDNSDPFSYADDVEATGGLADALGYSGRPYTTQSIIRYLPSYDGHFQTTNTYRFLTVREQIFTMIGEHKHGLWQVQESGFIREYLAAGATGLPSNATQGEASLLTLMESYSSYLPDPDEPYNWAGYASPTQRVNSAGTLQYIDLPITHPKYGGKYDDHVPIDLRLWYCTMSEPLAPTAAELLKYTYAQPGANIVGELGKRAGLDISELYTNTVRLHTFPDARAWFNMGERFTTEKAVNGEVGSVKYVAVDPSRTYSEYYLVERPFFNVLYYFVVAVFDDAMGAKSTHSYMRPQGAYWDSLVIRGFKESDFNTEVKVPEFYYTTNTKITMPNGAYQEIAVEKPATASGLPLYGGHGLNRADFSGGGGACPNRGGDWADYPAASGGAGWPTQYQEVAPLCDAVVLDIKLFANLHNNPANDDTIGLPSTGRGLDPVEYKLLSYPIGKYDTEYDIGGSKFLEGKINPEYFDYPAMLEEGEVGDPISLNFTYNRPVRQYISYIGDKPMFPLPYAEPEAGCCERVDMPFDYAIVEEPPTDAPTPKKKKAKTKVKDSNGNTRERKLRGA